MLENIQFTCPPLGIYYLQKMCKMTPSTAETTLNTKCVCLVAESTLG